MGVARKDFIPPKARNSEKQADRKKRQIMPKEQSNPIYAIVGSQPSSNAPFGISISTKARFASTLCVYALPFEFTTNHWPSHLNPD